MSTKKRRTNRNPKSTAYDSRKGDRDFSESDDSTSRRRSSRKPDTRKNDAAWYTRAGEQLVLDAGRLSFNVPTGSPIMWDMPDEISSINSRPLTNYKLPGVMRLEFTPTYGVANEANDPINVAARSIYSNIRKANSGSWNYDPNDLMLYLMAMDNCFIYFQRMCRAYGIVHVFSQLNRHIPETLADALFIDYDDLLANQANFRYYINTVCAKLGSLCVPNNMPIFERHMWMAAGVYSDAPTPKSQMYVFDPHYVGIYVERSDTGGRLMPVDITGDTTFAAMKSRMDSLIGALISSQDCGIISGDIRKAYESNVFMVNGIGDDYSVLPMYSEEVLRQIQNATIFDGINISSEGLIYQDIDSNILKTGYQMYVTSAMFGGDRILTGSDATPDPSEVIVNSRFMVIGDIQQAAPSGTASATNPNRYLFTPSSLGTEVITKAMLFGVDRIATSVPNTVAYSKRYTDNLSTTGLRLNNMLSFLINYSEVENFNYHPRVGVVAEITAAEDGTVSNEANFSFQDVDNYCVVSDPVLFNLHNTALLSLFDVPALGAK